MCGKIRQHYKWFHINMHAKMRIYIYIYIFVCISQTYKRAHTRTHTHTHTHTHLYIYIYNYGKMNGLLSLFMSISSSYIYIYIYIRELNRLNNLFVGFLIVCWYFHVSQNAFKEKCSIILIFPALCIYKGHIYINISYRLYTAIICPIVAV